METVVGFCNSHNMSLYNFISQSPPTINAAASSITWYVNNTSVNNYPILKDISSKLVQQIIILKNEAF